jgi:regulator of sigma E protease
MVLFAWGKDELPLSQIHTGLYYSDLLLEEGFQQQDHIISINGVQPESLSDIIESLILAGDRDVMVLRGADTLQLTMSADLGVRYMAIQNDLDREERAKERADKYYVKRSYTLISYYMPFIIDTVMPGGAASFADLRRGDVITAVNGHPCPCHAQLRPLLSQYPCDSVTISYVRDTTALEARIFIGDQGLMGAWQVPAWEYYQPVHTSFTFLEAIPAGIRYGWEKLVLYVKQFRLVFTKEGAQSVGGFGAISSMFAPVWSWPDFWHMTAFLSLILAFMNFLPIPALDGGYILFLLWEMLTGRKPSDKFLEVANNIGFWLLLLLMIFANGNDIFKAFF